MYSFGTDKIIARYSDESEVSKADVGYSAKAVSVDENNVFVLTHQDEVVIFGA